MNKEKLYLATKDELNEFIVSSEAPDGIIGDDPTTSPFFTDKFNEINNRISNLERQFILAVEMLEEI